MKGNAMNETLIKVEGVEFTAQELAEKLAAWAVDVVWKGKSSDGKVFDQDIANLKTKIVEMLDCHE